MRVFALAVIAFAQRFTRYDTSECIGVYGSNDIQGQESKIEVQIQPKVTKGQLAVTVFRYEDKANIQIVDGDFLLCSQRNVETGTCRESELGKFHINQTPKYNITNEILSWNVTELFPDYTVKLKHVLKETGFYCIYLTSDELRDKVDFVTEFIVMNPFGRLPAIFYPAMQFYYYMTIIYSILILVWVIKSSRAWSELMLIQIYFSAVLGFLLLETLINSTFFQVYNQTGHVNHTLLVFMVILNALKNSLSFFMLLIICLGFGVVKPTLGSTMPKCIALAVTHFLFGSLHGSFTMVADDINSTLVFIVTLPLSLTMTVFYMWIMSGLSETMEYLDQKRQGVKLQMYKRLHWIMVTSIVVLFIILVVNSVNMSHRHEVEWITGQFKWRWMVLEGSMNILYFLVVVAIGYLWRPTENNKRYGLDQLPTDDFEEHAVVLEETLTRRNSKYREEDYEETAEEILAWAEENIKDDLSK